MKTNMSKIEDIIHRPQALTNSYG